MLNPQLITPAVMNLAFTGADKYQTTLTSKDEITLDPATKYVYILSLGASLFYALGDTFATITGGTGAGSTGMIPAGIPTLIEIQDTAGEQKLTKLKLASAVGSLTSLFIYAG